MNLLGSLIPGVREVRAPLVSGYLWCVFLWLLLASNVPTEHGQPTYEHLVELADAMGPVGKAVAVSIAAYLLGSLIQSLASGIWARVGRRIGPMFRLMNSTSGASQLIHDHEDAPTIGDLASIANPFGWGWRWRSFGLDDPGLLLTIEELADRELSESYRALERAVDIAERRKIKPRPTFFMSGRTPMVKLEVTTSDGSILSAEFVIPHLNAPGDLFEQRSLLETRLLEIAPGTGAQVERLHAEAEFRFAVAGPLTVIGLFLANDVSLLWACALLVPIALIAQGIQLSRQATRELFDALRARSQTPELERITPVYERYRGSSTRLVDWLSKSR